MPDFGPSGLRLTGGERDNDQECRSPDPRPDQHEIGLAHRNNLGRRVERDREAQYDGQHGAQHLRQRTRQRDQQSGNDRDPKHRLVGEARHDACGHRREPRRKRRRVGDERQPTPPFLPADQKPEREDADHVIGHEHRMQHAAPEAANAERRRMRQRGLRPHRNHQRQQRSGSLHANRLRKTTPANAITAPTVRTAISPAGQRASRPKAMPARCSNPVAMTNPAE